MMKIIFAGTPDFAVPALQALLDSKHSVVAVYTQPDRPSGRGRKLQPGPVKQLALEHQLPICQPVSLRVAEAKEELFAFDADLMVVAAYGLILPLAVLQAPSHGCLNIHGSLLPRWRGAAPIHRAIAAGDKSTGITIMQMAQGLDTGDMLLKRELPISATATGSSLHDQLAPLGAEALMATLELLEQGQLTPEKQSEAEVTYAHKLKKSEAKIDWQDDAAEIARAVRAFNAWPVAQTTYGEQTLRIWQAAADLDNSAELAGSVLQEDPERGIQVACGRGSLWIEQLQLPGKRPMLARDFLNAKSLLGQKLA